MNNELPSALSSGSSANRQPQRSGKLLVVAVVVVVILIAVGAAIWWLNKPQTSKPQPGTNPTTTVSTQEIPPLPNVFYDISGIIKTVEPNQFTITTRIRTEKNTIKDAYRDAVLTVRYDDATKFITRGAISSNGQLPATTKASAADLKVGLGVDVHSRENLHGLDSFVAGQVTIKANNPATTAKK